MQTAIFGTKTGNQPLTSQDVVGMCFPSWKIFELQEPGVQTFLKILAGFIPGHNVMMGSIILTVSITYAFPVYQHRRFLIG
jgi:hypothetical protein